MRRISDNEALVSTFRIVACRLSTLPTGDHLSAEPIVCSFSFACSGIVIVKVRFSDSASQIFEYQCREE